jgi:hypothetical protein
VYLDPLSRLGIIAWKQWPVSNCSSLPSLQTQCQPSILLISETCSNPNKPIHCTGYIMDVLSALLFSSTYLFPVLLISYGCYCSLCKLNAQTPWMSGDLGAEADVKSAGDFLQQGAPVNPSQSLNEGEAETRRRRGFLQRGITVLWR